MYSPSQMSSLSLLALPYCGWSTSPPTKPSPKQGDASLQWTSTGPTPSEQTTPLDLYRSEGPSILLLDQWRKEFDLERSESLRRLRYARYAASLATPPTTTGTTNARGAESNNATVLPPKTTMTMNAPAAPSEIESEQSLEGATARVATNLASTAIVITTPHSQFPRQDTTTTSSWTEQLLSQSRPLQDATASWPKPLSRSKGKGLTLRKKK